jgi:hypothetical protein
MSRLLLGPIVGHTDHASTRIWIRVHDDPADYTLRVHGRGQFPFGSTESGAVEFGTALAVADGLRPEWEYRYHVLRRGRAVPETEGVFRTMPLPGSTADALFVSLSCSDGKDQGAWPLLSRYVKSAHPRFLIMLGDQVYLDNDDDIAVNVWKHYLDAKPAARRQAMAEKYQEHWSKEPTRTLLANTPTYMMWDDHDIRNGWGSLAPDSPTLTAQYPRGAKIAAQYASYFEDARDLYWHFQACRNPRPPAALTFPAPGARNGMPFVFRCGRLAVVVLDNRGARDLWRDSHPVLGDAQWTFLSAVLNELPAEVDALALVVPLPLSSMSPTGVVQRLLGDRTDDVEMFKQGDAEGLRRLSLGENEGFFSSVGFNSSGVALGGLPITGDIGATKLGYLTDVRDNWANHFCQPEQAALIRSVGDARMTNRLPSMPRSVVFIGGDLHAGGVFSISATDPDFTAPSLVTSGISKQMETKDAIVGIVMNEDYEIAPGIRAHLQEFTHVYNFGVTQIVFGGDTAVILNALAYKGSNQYLTIKLP